jgi:hypothetical protein
VVIIDGAFYVQKYTNEFSKLWAEFADNELERKQHQAASKI